MEEMEGMEQQNKDRGLQLGVKFAEVLWCLNDHLVSIEEELVASWEAMMEELRLLHHLLVHNLHQINQTLEGRRDKGEGESEVEESGEVEELEEQMEGVE